MAVDAQGEFPAHWAADVVLRDGRPCHIRPIEPSDADRLREFHAALSERTIYYRYFAPYPELTAADVKRFTEVDYHDRVALIATVADEIIGVGRFDRSTPDEAEVAFTVRDDHQGRGLGSVLLEHLAAAARERGINRFFADVLPQNRRMQATFEESGYRTRRELEDGYLRLEFAIEPTARMRAVMEARERATEARSIRRLLNPETVAVIGASRTPGQAGHELLRHLHEGGFTGTVYAVHPEADSILGFPCLRSVTQATVPVDLAIVAVPADAVLGVVNDCAEAGVRGLVVVSAGFAESGEDGRVRQRDLVNQARGNGMRVVGPAALGVINTDPHVRLNASFVQTMPARGRVGFFCQSGGLGRVIIDRMMSRGLALSTFVSAGNRSDVSGNDMLQFWSESNVTDVVLLYLESLGNPRKFTRIAKRLSRSKPVVAVRSGRSSQALPLGHSVRKSALPAAAIDSLIDQCGVIQTSSVRELLDIASVLAFQPAPKATSVAIIATAEALSVLAVDAALAAGINVAWNTTVAVSQSSPAADSQSLHDALRRADRDETIGAVLVVHVPPMPSDVKALRDCLLAVVPDLSTPVVAVTTWNAGEVRQGRAGDRVEHSPWIGGTLADASAQAGSVPIFSTVEEAAVALAAVLRRAAWIARDPGQLPEFAQATVSAGQELVDAALAGRERVELSDEQSAILLGCVGVSVNPTGGPPDGIPCRIELVTDDLFGSVLSFGLIGDIPELLGDRAYASPPLTDVDAADLVRAPATAALLQGHGGSAPVDLKALELLVCAVAALADTYSELSDLTLDVAAHPHGADVVLVQASLSSVSFATERRAM